MLRKPRARKLHLLLARARPELDAAERLEWLESVAHWVRTGLDPQAKLEILLEELERNEVLRGRVAATLARTFGECSGTRLFARAGLPSEVGLFSEAAERLISRFLPRRVEQVDLSELVHRVFPALSDARWVARIDDEALSRLQAALFAEPAGKLRAELGEAAILLAASCQAIGLSDAVRRLERDPSPLQSSFLGLVRECERLNEGRPRDPDAALAHARRCLERVRGLTAHQENESRSAALGLLFDLEKLSRSLERLETVLALHGAEPRAERSRRILGLVADLIAGLHSDRSLMELVRGNLGIVSRRIVEHSGAHGEDYITRTRAEYFHMLVMAGGGGLVTGFTAAFKFLISKSAILPFFQAALAVFDYGASFLLMQFLGFKLATKQPSMTAATLAGRMKEQGEGLDRAGFADEVARITRSQLAAALGNLVVVIPVAWAIDLFWRMQTGVALVAPSSARGIVASFDPLGSWTLPFAFLTGIILFVSSLSSGWAQNWSNYRELPERFRESPTLRRWLGSRGSAALGTFLDRHFAAAFGAVSLAVMLVIPGVIGGVLGIPLDVRHVTLSAGSLVFAVCSLGPFAFSPSELGLAIAGILCIGLLNFGVSFLLALAVAMRARDLGRTWIRVIVLSVGKKFLQRPLDFVLPPAEKP